MNVGEYDKAVGLYNSMRTKKVKPDCVTFTMLISGCCKMSRYSEALSFWEEMMHLKLPLSKEVYSYVICACCKQGQLTEAESAFDLMKKSGYDPDVVTYTAMLHSYSASGYWEKAYALFEEMVKNYIKPDTIGCAALMRAFNEGGQPRRALNLAESMREQEIPFTDAIISELLSACSLLRDWRTAVELIIYVEPLLPVASVGLINQFLHFLGKSGKTEAMMKLFYKMVASGADISFTTYSVLLKNLVSSGNWRKCIEVLQWMEDAGICPPYEIYYDIYSYALKSCGAESAAIIKERLESLKRKARVQMSTSESS